MRKIVWVGDQEYELGTNGYTPIAYKQQFGERLFSRFVFNVEKSIIHE
ncbi:bacteriophage pi2 protein 40 [Streptococcus pneumoniae]|nr:bacteriophage pi2 protein 40 [Streptococcus pneumoniae]VMV02022.1 bacteriophage pi2 protein 40 [Streptococcus pneumoniae]VNK99196.1 bacteriophage pi2 protein 40 [Streptococcus pneumoniae]VOK84946.1 bacteriophage pi2 protein 40 [Streptococcus pneumoniae]VPZ34878.1 bacteriophage pi2 protein 40 [Streptococcus pneumoniae]